jgi:hypothetical protein
LEVIRLLKRTRMPTTHIPVFYTSGLFGTSSSSSSALYRIWSPLNLKPSFPTP